MTPHAQPMPTACRTPRPAVLAVLGLAILAGCGAPTGGGSRDHRNPNADWARLTGLPVESVAGVSQTARGGLVLVESGAVTAPQAAAVPTHLCAASGRIPAAAGVMQPVSGHSKIRKIVVTCQG